MKDASYARPKARWISLLTAAAVAIGMLTAHVMADGPQPAVGIYWTSSVDPTVGAGMAAPLWQLLIRTDTPSIYYKSGAANTAWTRIGAGASGGGTVTGTGTANTVTKWTGVSSIGNSSATDNGTTYTIGAGGFAVVEASGQTEAPELDATGVVASTATSGTVNNWDPTGGSPGNLNGLFKVNQSPSALLTLTGMIAGNAGQLIELRDTSTTAGDGIVINNESSSSSAANRFTLPNAASLTIAAGGSCTFRYSGTASRWEPLSHCGQTLTAIANATITITDTGTQNDYNPTGLSSATMIRGNNGAGLTIDGIVGGQDGRVLYICATNSAGNIVLANEAAGSTAANRIWAENNSNIQLAASTNSNACAQLIYDATSSRWRVIAANTSNNVPAISFGGGITASGITMNAGSMTLSTPTGHVSVVGATAPSLTSCGSTPSPTIHGSDFAAKFTTGGTATACTYTFAGTYTNAPACVVTAEGGAALPTYTISATAISFTVDVATTTYNVICVKVQ